ncbi:MAG: BrnT family toxin [Anaerolineae bacterium]|jgi:hypothetical protein|nr:BrnT family toxin [Anaerolineae bacterium]
MKIEWNEEKRWQNSAKHAIDFQDAAAIFDGPVVTIEDDRLDYGEARWIAVGLMQGRVIVVIYALRGDAIRLISARRATKYEAAEYWRNT